MYSNNSRTTATTYKHELSFYTENSEILSTQTLAFLFVGKKLIYNC